MLENSNTNPKPVLLTHFPFKRAGMEPGRAILGLRALKAIIELWVLLKLVSPSMIHIQIAHSRFSLQFSASPHKSQVLGCRVGQGP